MPLEPARSTLAGELLDRVIALATGVGEIGDFPLRRIEHEAGKAMSADPVGTHVVQGAIASLRNDVPAVQRHYKIALEQSANSTSVWHNFSVSLGQVGLTGEAFEAAREAWERVPDSHTHLLCYLEAAIEWAKFDVAVELCGKWHKLFGKPSAHDATAYILHEAVKRGDLQEARVRNILRIAHSVRSEARVRHNAVEVFPDPTEPGTYLFEVRILDSPAKAAYLNEQLAERMAEEKPDPVSAKEHVVYYLGDETAGSAPRVLPYEAFVVMFLGVV